MKRNNRIVTAEQRNKLPERDDMIRLARLARLMVKSAATAMVLVFGWLKLRGVDFAPLASNLSADLLFKVSMSLYFLCWVAGTLSDIADQELVYLRPPTKQGRMPFGGWVTWIALTIVFGVLCWVDSYRNFTLCLALFLIINVLGWRYLVGKLLPHTVRMLEKEYRLSRNYIGLEQLKLVYHRYLNGRWQWLRFATGSLVIVLLGCTSFTAIGSALANRLGLAEPDLVISAEILLFVLIMEGWIWTMRAQVKSGLRVLREVNSMYTLVELSTA